MILILCFRTIFWFHSASIASPWEFPTAFQLYVYYWIKFLIATYSTLPFPDSHAMGSSYLKWTILSSRDNANGRSHSPERFSQLITIPIAYKVSFSYSDIQQSQIKVIFHDFHSYALIQNTQIPCIPMNMMNFFWILALKLWYIQNGAFLPVGKKYFTTSPCKAPSSLLPGRNICCSWKTLDKVLVFFNLSRASHNSVHVHYYSSSWNFLVKKFQVEVLIARQEDLQNTLRALNLRVALHQDLQNVPYTYYLQFCFAFLHRDCMSHTVSVKDYRSQLCCFVSGSSNNSSEIFANLRPIIS